MIELPRVLRFRAGELELGVLVPEVARIVDPTALVRVPYAHPALAGLWIDDEGAQTPVYELRGLVDPRAAFDDTAPITAFLLFDTSAGPIGLRVEKVRGTLDDYARADGEHEIEAELHPALAGRGQAGDGQGFEFFSPGAFLVALDLERPLRPEENSG